MDPNRLFIARCEQMSKLLQSDNEVELLDLSGVVRQLLFDKHSLVDTVNTNKIKLRWRVRGLGNTPPGLPVAAIHSMQDGLDPDTAPPFGEIFELTPNQFLQHVVLRLEGKD